MCVRFRDYLQSEDGYRLLCETISLEAGLYVPLNYRTTWKRLFWDHLVSALARGAPGGNAGT